MPPSPSPRRVTREEILEELERMRRLQTDLETCRIETRTVRERYDNLLESAPDALVFVDERGKIVLVNAQMEKMFGYSQEEVVGRALSLLVPERFRKRHRENVRRFFQNPRSRPMGTPLQIYARRKDGTEFPADISLSTLQVDGQVLATGAVRDITERKRAEEEVQLHYQIQRVISAALEVSLEPISLEAKLERILDLIFSAPRLALQPKGAIYLAEGEPSTLVRKAMRGFPAPLAARCEAVAVGVCLCGQAADTCAIACSTCLGAQAEAPSEGEHPHGHHCVPISCEEEALGVINVFIEASHPRTGQEDAFLKAIASTVGGVIARHRAQEEKERLRGELAQSMKLAALGRLTDNVAHYLRNPLMVVGGFARRLERRIAAEGEEMQYVRAIRNEVTRLEEILQNVLVFSKVSVPENRPQALSHILDRALEPFDQACRRRGIRVVRSYRDLPPVPLDRGQVLDALERLIGNAVEAMPEGGTLSTETAREEEAGEEYAVARISDTGPGIPDGEWERIFEPFYTTKGGGEKLGLGLAIARKAAEDHGGFLRGESAPEQPTTFSLYLPLGKKSNRTRPDRPPA